MEHPTPPHWPHSDMQHAVPFWIPGKPLLHVGPACSLRGNVERRQGGESTGLPPLEDSMNGAHGTICTKACYETVRRVKLNEGYGVAAAMCHENMNITTLRNSLACPKSLIYH